jgi:hypothetical protein
VFVGVNGILVAVARNPPVVTLAVGQIVFAEGLHYSNGLAETDALALVGLRPEQARRDHQPRLLGRRGITLAVALRSATAPGRRFRPWGKPEGRVDGRRARPGPRRLRLHGRGHALRDRGSAARGRANQRRPVSACLSTAPIAAVVIAGASLSGGLASATSTWVAALALTLLNQMLLILGLSVGWQFIVFGAAIIVGMLISGDRVASLLGRLMRPKEAPARIAHGMNEPTS